MSGFFGNGYTMLGKNCEPMTNCTALGMKIEIDGSETTDNTCSCVSPTQFVNSTTGQCQERDVCPPGQEANNEPEWNENVECKCISDDEFFNSDDQCQVRDSCPDGQEARDVQYWNMNILCRTVQSSGCGDVQQSTCVTCGKYGEPDTCGRYGESDACGRYGTSAACGLFGTGCV